MAKLYFFYERDELSPRSKFCQLRRLFTKTYYHVLDQILLFARLIICCFAKMIYVILDEYYSSDD